MAKVEFEDLAVLRWQRFSGVDALCALRAASTNFSASAHSFLMTALARQTVGESSRVAINAVTALAHVAGRGDLEAISAATACLGHMVAAPRAAAALALGELAELGEACAVEHLASRVQKDGAANVREAALNALVRLTSRGDAVASVAAAAASWALEDISPSVRRAAVVALGCLAPRGDQGILSALAAHLGDRSSEVRKAVMISLEQLTDRGDAVLVSMVAAHLGNIYRRVRQAAVVALGRLASLGDTAAISELVAHLGDSNRDVRKAAVVSLGKLVEKGNSTVITAVAAHLDDPSWEVCKAAMATLEHLTNSSETEEMFSMIRSRVNNSMRRRMVSPP